MSLKDFELIKELGKGAFGSVCLVKRIADGNVYAIKRVKISQLNKKEQENALNEVRILASLSHPNIIGYKEAFFDDESKTLNMVMEYADDGDLESKIQKHQKNKTNFSENEIWSYLIQMIQGLKSLHDNKIMHRDLKSANVFLMKNGILKLGDLNVSKVVKMGLVYTQTGTPYYASPEVWADKPYDYKSDIWSVGCVIYELCALKPPFRGQNLDQLYQCVKKGMFDPIPSIYSKELAKTIGLLLAVNPNHRPDCDALLCNPLILKRMDFNKNIDYGSQAQLLGTIKLPRNMNEINQKLPKTKKYEESTGFTLKKFPSTEISKSIKNPTENRKELAKPPSAKIINKVVAKKILTNSIEIESLNDFYDKNHTAENVNKSKISDRDDDFFKEEKESKSKKIVNKKNNIPPTYEECQMLIALNNSVQEGKSKKLNVEPPKNKIQNENLRDNPTIIKQNSNKVEKKYEKIQKTNQIESRSKTPNQPTVRKDKLINANREIQLINERTERNMDNLYRNINEKPKIDEYINLVLNTDENRYSKNKDKFDFKINKPDSIIYNSNIKDNNSNNKYIKLNLNENPKYKNIYNPQLYSKINPKPILDDEKGKNLNNDISSANNNNNNQDSNKYSIGNRAMSARPNRISNNPITSSIINLNNLNNNVLINKKLNSNPLSKINNDKEKDLFVNKILDSKAKKNIIANIYNSIESKNMLNDYKNPNSKMGVVSKDNQVIRPISSRDRVMVNQNGYNVLSKNIHPINPANLLNSQINNNYNKNLNVIKKDILNYNDKFNLISPIKIGDNIKKPVNYNLLNNDNFLSNNNQRYPLLDRNIYLNIKLNNVNKPININPYKK